MLKGTTPRLKRAPSNEELKSKATGTAETCFGVSQGYYAVKHGIAIGTSSLASCFALIAREEGGGDVFLAHVQAGTTVDSIVKALVKSFGETAPSEIYIVRGASVSKPTQEIIDALPAAMPAGCPEVKLHSTTSTATVVVSASGAPSTPANIKPTNAKAYTTNHLKASMKSGPWELAEM